MHFIAVAMPLHSGWMNEKKQQVSMERSGRMGSSIDDTTVPLVACEVCLKRMGKDVAKQAETPHYTAYFCSDECLQRWHAQHGREVNAR